MGPHRKVVNASKKEPDVAEEIQEQLEEKGYRQMEKRVHQQGDKRDRWYAENKKLNPKK